MTEQKQWYH